MSPPNTQPELLTTSEMFDMTYDILRPDRTVPYAQLGENPGLSNTEAEIIESHAESLVQELLEQWLRIKSDRQLYIVPSPSYIRQLSYWQRQNGETTLGLLRVDGQLDATEPFQADKITLCKYSLENNLAFTFSRRIFDNSQSHLNFPTNMAQVENVNGLFRAVLNV